MEFTIMQIFVKIISEGLAKKANLTNMCFHLVSTDSLGEVTQKYMNLLNFTLNQRNFTS